MNTEGRLFRHRRRASVWLQMALSFGLLATGLASASTLGWFALVPLGLLGIAGALRRPVGYRLDADGVSVCFPFRRRIHRRLDLLGVDVHDACADVHTRLGSFRIQPTVERWLDLADSLAEMVPRRRQPAATAVPVPRRRQPAATAVPVDPDDLAVWLDLPISGRLVVASTPRPWLGCGLVLLLVVWVAMAVVDGPLAGLLAVAVTIVVLLPALWALRHDLIPRRIIADVDGLCVRVGRTFRDYSWADLRSISLTTPVTCTTRDGSFWYQDHDLNAAELTFAIERAIEARRAGWQLPHLSRAGEASLSRAAGEPAERAIDRSLSRLGSELDPPAAEQQDAG